MRHARAAVDCVFVDISPGFPGLVPRPPPSSRHWPQPSRRGLPQIYGIKKFTFGQINVEGLNIQELNILNNMHYKKGTFASEYYIRNTMLKIQSVINNHQHKAFNVYYYFIKYFM